MQALLRQLRCRGGLSSAIVNMTHGNTAADVSAATFGQTQFSGSMASVVQLLRGLRSANPSLRAHMPALSQRGLANVAGCRHQRDIFSDSSVGSGAVSSAGSAGSNVQYGSIAMATAGCRGLSTSGARRHSAADAGEPQAEQPANLNPLQASTIGRRLLLALNCDDIADSYDTRHAADACKFAFLCHTGSARCHREPRCQRQCPRQPARRAIVSPMPSCAMLASARRSSTTLCESYGGCTWTRPWCSARYPSKRPPSSSTRYGPDAEHLTTRKSWP